MAFSIQSSKSSKNFSNEILEEAKKYNGRRIKLRQLVDTGKKPMELLEAHTQLMLANRGMMKGVLFELQLREKKVHVLGVCHARIVEMEKDVPDNKEDALKILCSFIHPIVMEILNKSELYVEVNMKDPENFVNTIIQIAMNDLVIRDPLPRLERTKFIEDIAMKICVTGLDLALMEHQYINRKKVYSLETVEDHIESLQSHFHFQRKDPKNFLLSNEWLLENIDAIQWSNLDSITELNKGMPEDIVKGYQKRNKKMAVQIFDKLSSGENSLFAVGIAHLIGEKSILTLLKEREVLIKQIIL